MFSKTLIFFVLVKHHFNAKLQQQRNHISLRRVCCEAEVTSGRSWRRAAASDARRSQRCGTEAERGTAARMRTILTDVVSLWWRQTRERRAVRHNMYVLDGGNVFFAFHVWLSQGDEVDLDAAADEDRKWDSAI